MAHTPGQWEYMDREDGAFGVYIPNGHSLFYDLEGSCPQCFDNMRLIAVAPELLEACTAALWRLKQYDYAAMEPTIKKLEVAIAKAKGDK